MAQSFVTVHVSHQQLQHEVRWEDLILVSTCICLAMTLRATPSSGSPWNSWEGFSPYWLPISEKKLQVVVCKARPQLKKSFSKWVLIFLFWGQFFVVLRDQSGIPYELFLILKTVSLGSLCHFDHPYAKIIMHLPLLFHVNVSRSFCPSMSMSSLIGTNTSGWLAASWMAAMSWSS